MSSDWERVFGRETPWSDLQTIIDERITDALHVRLQTLSDDHDLSDSQRAQVWAFAAPKIREQHRAVREAAWRDLQQQAPATETVQ